MDESIAKELESVSVAMHKSQREIVETFTLTTRTVS